MSPARKAKPQRARAPHPNARAYCKFGHHKGVGRRCHLCQREHQRSYSRGLSSKRKRGGSSSEPTLPLQGRLLTVLCLVRRHSDIMWDEISEKSEISTNSVMMALGRLRKLGLVTTRLEPFRHASGRLIYHALNSATPEGQRFIDAWLAFVKALGPSAKMLEWRAP